VSTVVSKAAKQAKESTPKGKTKTVKLTDDVIVPDPDVKHGTEVFTAGTTLEVPEAFADRYVRVGVAEDT
jgi:hypothetical protein